MSRYLLALYVTLEEEEAIRQLYISHGWQLTKKNDEGDMTKYTSMVTEEQHTDTVDGSTTGQSCEGSGADTTIHVSSDHGSIAGLDIMGGTMDPTMALVASNIAGNESNSRAIDTTHIIASDDAINLGQDTIEGIVDPKIAPIVSSHTDLDINGQAEDTTLALVEDVAQKTDMDVKGIDTTRENVSNDGSSATGSHRCLRQLRSRRKSDTTQVASRTSQKGHNKRARNTQDVVDKEQSEKLAETQEIGECVTAQNDGERVAFPKPATAQEIEPIVSTKLARKQDLLDSITSSKSAATQDVKENLKLKLLSKTHNMEEPGNINNCVTVQSPGIDIKSDTACTSEHEGTTPSRFSVRKIPQKIKAMLNMDKRDEVVFKEVKKRDQKVECTKRHKQQRNTHNITEQGGEVDKIDFAEAVPVMRDKTLQNEGKTCTVCKCRFKTLKSFENHQKCRSSCPLREAVTPDNTFFCQLCTQTFQTGEEYISHRNGKSSKTYSCVQQLICEFCGKVFALRRRSDFITHVKFHRKDYAFVCDTCGKGFMFETGLASHKLSHTGEKPHTCTYCPARFVSKITRVNHERCLHLNHPHSHVCHICGAAFQLRGRLTSHLTFVHCSELRYQCTDCGKKFKANAALQVHIKGHHNIKDKVCDICGKAFTKTAAMNSHKKRHFNERSHFCDDCGKGFYSKVNLVQHRRVHSGEKPYKCSHCEYSVAIRGNLLKHIRNMHKHKLHGGIAAADYSHTKDTLQTNTEVVSQLTEVVSTTGASIAPQMATGPCDNYPDRRVYAAGNEHAVNTRSTSDGIVIHISTDDYPLHNNNRLDNANGRHIVIQPDEFTPRPVSNAPVTSYSQQIDIPTPVKEYAFRRNLELANFSPNEREMEMSVTNYLHERRMELSAARDHVQEPVVRQPDTPSSNYILYDLNQHQI